MSKKPAIRSIFLLWLGWAILLISFQALVSSRYEPSRPDRVLGWTGSLTTKYGLADQPYLNDPFMNNQVSWDSDMYLPMTHSVGLALVAPLALAWIQELDWRHPPWRSFTWKSLGKALLVLAPAAAYLGWRISELDQLFQVVEHEYFGRGFLNLAESWEGWQSVIASLGGDNRQTAVYFQRNK